MGNNDLIKKYCAGEDFGWIECDYYNKETQGCSLLLPGKYGDMWTKCRYDSKAKVKQVARKVGNNYEINKEYSKQEDYEKDIKSILENVIAKTSLMLNELNKAVLPVWIEYIKRTTYNEAVTFWDIRRIRKKCGNCIHLSSSNPHTCTLIKMFDATENPNYGKQKRGDDPPCSEHTYFINIPMEEDPRDGKYGGTQDKHPSNEKEVNTKLDLTKMADLLYERAKKEKDEIRRKRYFRQFLVFVLLIHGYSKIEIADELGVTERTINRDIEEIREYLKRKCPEY